MSSYIKLPVVFFHFWFLEAPMELISFFGTFNHAFLQLFSLPLFIRTFFKPLKNEYRKGLVEFSIVMGMAVKAVLIAVDLVLFGGLLFIETGFIVLFFVFPFIPIALLFW